MSFISSILKANPIGAVVGKVLDGLPLMAAGKAEKQQAILEIEKVVAKRDADVESTLRTELEAKERVLVAELMQGDLFTKRARPAVVYGGLIMICFNYSIAPAVGVPRIDLPTEFWAGWSGIVATWSIGRSVEKSGRQNKATQAITGSKLFQ